MSVIRLLLTLAITTSMGGLAVCGAGAVDAPENTGASQLFVQTADAGTWASNGDGTHTLALTAPASRVTVFADRPSRLASTITTEELVDQWASFGFDAVPPNAAIVVNDGPTGEKTIVVELRNPVLVGTSIQYNAQVVANPSGAFSRYDVDDDLPAVFDRASLFIDNASSVVFSMTIQVENMSPDGTLALALTGVPGSIGNDNKHCGERFRKCGDHRQWF